MFTSASGYTCAGSYGSEKRGREGEAGREEEDMEVEREGGEVKVPLSCVEGHLS